MVTLEVPVAWGDMDALRHVNNTVYLRWFESARIAYFERVGLVGDAGLGTLGPILARATIDFRRPVVYPDTITVVAAVPKLRNTSFEMTYRATSAARGAVVAEGDSVIVVLDYATGTKAPIPDELRTRIERFEGR